MPEEATFNYPPPNSEPENSPAASPLAGFFQAVGAAPESSGISRFIASTTQGSQYPQIRQAMEQHVQESIAPEVQRWQTEIGPEREREARPVPTGNWATMEPILRQQFPGVNTRNLREEYEQLGQAAFRGQSLDLFLGDFRQQYNLPQYQQMSSTDRLHVGAGRTPSAVIDYWITKGPGGEARDVFRRLRYDPALERVERGNASASDYATVAEYMVRLEREGMRDATERIRDSILSMPGFAGEMVATGPIGRAVGGLVGAGAARVAPRFAATAGGQLATQAAALPFQAAAQAAAMPARIAATAVERTNPEVRLGGPNGVEVVRRGNWYDPGQLGRGYLDTVIEVGTENMGELFPAAAQWVRTNRGTQAVAGMAQGLASRWVNAVPGRTVQQFQRLASSTAGARQIATDTARSLWGGAGSVSRKTGIHGLPSEMLEERIGEVLRYATGLNEDAGATGNLAYGLSQGTLELLGLTDTQGAAAQALRNAGSQLLEEGIAFGIGIPLQNAGVRAVNRLQQRGQQVPQPTGQQPSPAVPPPAADQSGPGRMTSDLDQITQDLGQGPAVREVPVQQPGGSAPSAAPAQEVSFQGVTGRPPLSTGRAAIDALDTSLWIAQNLTDAQVTPAVIERATIGLGSAQSEDVRDLAKRLGVNMPVRLTHPGDAVALIRKELIRRHSEATGQPAQQPTTQRTTQNTPTEIVRPPAAPGEQRWINTGTTFRDNPTGAVEFSSEGGPVYTISHEMREEGHRLYPNGGAVVVVKDAQGKMIGTAAMERLQNGVFSGDITSTEDSQGRKPKGVGRAMYDYIHSRIGEITPHSGGILGQTKEGKAFWERNAKQNAKAPPAAKTAPAPQTAQTAKTETRPVRSGSTISPQTGSEVTSKPEVPALAGQAAARAGGEQRKVAKPTRLEKEVHKAFDGETMETAEALRAVNAKLREKGKDKLTLASFRATLEEMRSRGLLESVELTEEQLAVLEEQGRAPETGPGTYWTPISMTAPLAEVEAAKAQIRAEKEAAAAPQPEPAEPARKRTRLLMTQLRRWGGVTRASVKAALGQEKFTELDKDSVLRRMLYDSKNGAGRVHVEDMIKQLVDEGHISAAPNELHPIEHLMAVLQDRVVEYTQSLEQELREEERRYLKEQEDVRRFKEASDLERRAEAAAREGREHREDQGEAARSEEVARDLEEDTGEGTGDAAEGGATGPGESTEVAHGVFFHRGAGGAAGATNPVAATPPLPGSEPRPATIRENIKETLAPTSRGAEAGIAAGVLRENNAVLARKRLVAVEKVREASKYFDDHIARQEDEKVKSDRFLEFMDAMEGGKIDTLPEAIRPFAEAMRDLIEERTKALGERQLVQSFIDNYVGHLWQKPGTALEAQQIGRILAGRRPLAGREGFKKARTIPTYRDGIEAGLVPVDWNPAKIVLLNLHEMDKSVMAHDVVQQFKENGLWKFFRLGQSAPAGWRSIEDKMARVFAPPQVQVREFFDKQQMEALEKFAASIGVNLERTMRGPPGVSKGGEIATRFGTPEEVLAHEIGHELDRKHNLKAMANDTVIGDELRELADLRASGQVSDEYQQYLRSPEEKIANLFAAYLHAPELLRQVAPNAAAKLDAFLASHPKLAPLRDIKPSLELGERDQMMRLSGPMLTGTYYMPEPVAKLLTNHLTPGLRGGAAFDVIREGSNALNLFQLGFSAFHGAFVLADTQISSAALGLQLLSRGEVAKSAKAFVGGLIPGVAAVRSFLQGNKLLKEYYQPGSQGAETAALVEALVRGGGRAKMDDFYGGDHFSRLREALKDVRHGKFSRIGGVLYNALPAVAEVLSKPVMEYLVPRMKLGVMASLAHYEMERIGEGAGMNEQRAALGRAWDSVENRLGQLTYDNLFWNRTLKDVLMIGVRSVGWNTGTIRELGGGLADVPSSIVATAKGQGISPRLAYLVALPMVTAFYGAMYQMLLTGQPPDDWRDYFFPRTGRIRKDGSEERVSIPGYMRDLIAVANRADEGPLRILSNIWTMAKHKLNPGVLTVAEMLDNENFYGQAIYDPKDPITSQARDLAMHLIGSFEPFTVRGFRQQQERGAGAGQAAQAFFGITPSPAYVTQTNEEQRANEQMRRFELTPLERRRRTEHPEQELFTTFNTMFRTAGQALQGEMTRTERDAVENFRVDVARMARGERPLSGNPFQNLDRLPTALERDIIHELTAQAGHIGDPRPPRHANETIQAWQQRLNSWTERKDHAQRFLALTGLSAQELQQLMLREARRRGRVTPGQVRQIQGVGR